VVRRFEVTVWCCAALVAVVMAAVLINGAPGSTPMVSAGAVPVVSGAVPVPVVSGAVSTVSPSAVSCFLVPCDRPVLTGPPTLLRIPAIGVTTTLESLVVNAAKQLQPPTDYAKAGWWTKGVAPGDVGPAVIAGHVDSARSGPAIFYNLHKLKPGDTVQVDRAGQTVTFSVTDVEQYPKDAFPRDRVYQPTPDAELRLITCGGEFDRTLLSYRDNIVVYAVLA
jgi:LPXTG-site transpeptidase (sortase) family protein